MAQASLRSVLRDRTRGKHAELDAALTGPGGQIADMTGYVRVLRSLHRLHCHADAALRTWTSTSPLASGLDPDLVPDRASAYAADLAVLGETVPTTPRNDKAVDDARGLALLYLVAGSAAGARVLLRGLPDAVPTHARRGLTDAAGRSSTVLWREAVALLERPTGPELQESVVAEATAVLQLLLDGTGQPELMAS